MRTVAEVVSRNGTGMVMPIKTVDIKLDEMGWPGWFVTMRTDPPSSVYDSLLAFDDEGRWWTAFGKIVKAWNLTDEDGQSLPLPKDAENEHMLVFSVLGQSLPLPKDAENEHMLDLRIGIISYVFSRYVDVLKANAAVPKVPAADSSSTSSTNGVSQGTA